MPEGGAPAAFVIVDEERLRGPESFSSREDEELLVLTDDVQWIAKDRDGLKHTLALGGLGFGLDLLGAYLLGVGYPTHALE
jgi:hypothetical protein